VSLMRLDLNDQRLTRSERRYLEALAEKLRPPSRQPLPLGYREAIEQAFGDCGEGDRDRCSLPRQHEREPSPTRDVTLSNPFEQVDPNRTGPFEMSPLHANTMNIVGLAYDRPRMAGERRMLFGTLAIDRDSRTVGKVFFAGHQERPRL
jgi:hypothetical protein